MKKLIKKSLLLFLAVILFGCSGSSLPKGFDEDEVISKAKDVVAVINTQDYTAVVSLLRSDLQGQVTAEQLQEAWGSYLDAAGDFKEFKTIVTKSQTDSATKEEYAVVVLETVYQNSTRVFTLSFNQELELVGLYMK
ncbi:MAG: DUF3887 domain-containing protein [Erysipelotrichaceae bacterium]|nr:DUF3887 domain-containing protein [Erysipelotrichaceae bacterium]